MKRGYYVEGHKFDHLNAERTKFIIHSFGYTPYVHLVDDLLRGGDWFNEAVNFYEAEFNEATEQSQRIGEAIPKAEFLGMFIPAVAAIAA